MRCILSLLLVILSLNVYSQEKKPTLMIFVWGSSLLAKDAPPFDPQLRVYRLPENTLAYKPVIDSTDGYYTWAQINNFIPGEYRIEYVNIFGQTLNYQYTKYTHPLDNRAAIFYTETIPKYAPDFLASMADGDSVMVKVISDNWDLSWAQSLVVKRKKDKWLATLYPAIAETRADGSNDSDTTTLAIPMDICKRAVFNEFIHELRLIKATDRNVKRQLYELRIGNRVESYIDDRGLWRGFIYLRQELLKPCNPPRYGIMLGYEPE